VNPDIYGQRRISMLTGELRQQVFQNHLLNQFKRSGTTPDGLAAWPEVMKHAPVQRIRVFTGMPETGTYNHHAGLCRWRDQYCYVWSNSAVHEDHPGQSVLLSMSADFRAWTEPLCVAPGAVAGDLWRVSAGVAVFSDRLTVFVITKTRHLVSRKPGMSANEPAVERTRIDVFTSDDSISWREQTILEGCSMLEPPRLTQAGRLLCAGTLGTEDPVVLLWPGRDPLQTPEIVKLPHDRARGLDAGVFPYGEASWYQTDQGDIFLFHRNETDAVRLSVAVSRDGGLSWTEPMPSDIPDSMSRVSAGRLPDGRFYLVGNTVADLMNRIPLILTLSNNGYKFETQYILLDEPTAISFPGALKVHGHQYPATLAENDRLLVAYSVNKEHMELLTVDLREL
jgi:hypothetical protein